MKKTFISLTVLMLLVSGCNSDSNAKSELYFFENPDEAKTLVNDICYRDIQKTNKVSDKECENAENALRLLYELGLEESCERAKKNNYFGVKEDELICCKRYQKAVKELEALKSSKN